jgi:type II secretory pathway predicted ATPase ExeA
MKVDEIIESALRKIQVTAPRSNEKADAMEALNDIRKELFSGGKQGQHAITVDTHTLTVSTGSYTIGTGATIDTLRPAI